MECKTIFDVLKNITDIKDESALGSGLYNPYMINRFLSMNMTHIHYASLLNRYSDIPKEYQEVLALHLISKSKVFFKYIKKESEKREYKDKKEELMREHKCSDAKAEAIIEFWNKIQNKKNGF